jgi:hypothetical protein
MKDLPPLDRLSTEEKDALIQELWQVVQALQAEVERLKGKRIKKMSRNSSCPPAIGFKPNSAHHKPSQSQRTIGMNGPFDGRELNRSHNQVIFQKSIQGFRSDWDAALFAQVSSLVNTAQRQSLSACEAIFHIFTSQQSDWLLSWVIVQNQMAIYWKTLSLTNA